MNFGGPNKVQDINNMSYTVIKKKRGKAQKGVGIFQDIVVETETKKRSLAQEQTYKFWEIGALWIKKKWMRKAESKGAHITPN